MTATPEHDAWDVAANYAGCVYAVLETASNLTRQINKRTTLDGIEFVIDPEQLPRLRDLLTQLNDYQHICDAWSELLAQMPTYDASDALAGFQNEIEGRLIRRLHQATHRLDRQDHSRVCHTETCLDLPNPDKARTTHPAGTEPAITFPRLGQEHAETTYATYNAISPALLENGVDLDDEYAFAHHAERVWAAHQGHHPAAQHHPQHRQPQRTTSTHRPSATAKPPPTTATQPRPPHPTPVPTRPLHALRERRLPSPTDAGRLATHRQATPSRAPPPPLATPGHRRVPPKGGAARSPGASPEPTRPPPS